MECATNPTKKLAYQAGLWFLFLGNIALFAAGCVAMALGVIPASWRGAVAMVLVGLVGALFPAFLLLIRGLSISGTQRVFLTDGTILFCTWDADHGAGGAKHRFYKVWKVSDYVVRRNRIEINAFVWYAERVMERGSLPVTDGFLADLPDLFREAIRCRREFSICRTLDHEEELLAALNSRKETAAGAEDTGSN